MASGIFLIQDGKLTEMAQQEPEKEKVLQDLLARHPSLLAGNEINPEAPRRFVLLARELGLASEEGGSARWSIDHLFIDQDAVPTIVEVKRSSDTRIRREVIGQLIEYAANGTRYWPIEDIRAQFDVECASRGLNGTERLRQELGIDQESEEFWELAKQNLDSGRIRMIFVGDVIPPELQRVVEFLNEQMSKAEVLAVELRYYRANQLTTLVPRVVGVTAKAQQVKPKVRRATIDDFVRHISAQHGQLAETVVQRFIDWAHNEPNVTLSAEAAADGYDLWPGLFVGGSSYWPIRIRHDGKLFVSFQSLGKRPPFSDEPKRKELMDRLNSLPGIDLPQSQLSGRPSISIADLAADPTLTGVLETLSWLMQAIRDHVEAAPTPTTAASGGISGGDIAL